MFRAVIDTNVLISAVISDGKPRELLKKGTAKQFAILTSEPILTELSTVLHRPKFKTTQEEIQKIVFALIQSSEVISIKSNFNVVKEDPKDNIFVNTAYDGQANFIVTGDNHLLKLKSFEGIGVIKTEDMLRLLEEP